MWPGVVFCDVMIEDKDVRLRVWLLDGGVVENCGWLCVLKEVWGVVQIVVGVVGKM